MICPPVVTKCCREREREKEETTQQQLLHVQYLDSSQFPSFAQLFDLKFF